MGDAVAINALSGGVDSSVAAALMADAGHDVAGVTLKLWGGDSDSGCCSVSDVDDARRVAQQLGVDHHVFNYADEFPPFGDAYETLLADVLAGDQTLFVHSEEVVASWRLFDPLLTAGRSPRPYAAGTWGPPEAQGHMHPGNYS